MDADAAAELLIDMSGWYMETALIEWMLDARLSEAFGNGALSGGDAARLLDFDADRLLPILDALVGMEVLDLAQGEVVREDLHAELGQGRSPLKASDTLHHVIRNILWHFRYFEHIEPFMFHCHHGRRPCVHLTIKTPRNEILGCWTYIFE